MTGRKRLNHNTMQLQVMLVPATQVDDDVCVHGPLRGRPQATHDGQKKESREERKGQTINLLGKSSYFDGTTTSSLMMRDSTNFGCEMWVLPEIQKPGRDLRSVSAHVGFSNSLLAGSQSRSPWVYLVRKSVPCSEVNTNVSLERKNSMRFNSMNDGTDCTPSILLDTQSGKLQIFLTVTTMKEHVRGKGHSRVVDLVPTDTTLNIESNCLVSGGLWSHIALQLTPKTAGLYVNGKLDSFYAAPAGNRIKFNQYPITIGGSVTKTGKVDQNGFIGVIQNANFYDFHLHEFPTSHLVPPVFERNTAVERNIAVVREHREVLPSIAQQAVHRPNIAATYVVKSMLDVGTSSEDEKQKKIAQRMDLLDGLASCRRSNFASPRMISNTYEQKFNYASPRMISGTNDQKSNYVSPRVAHPALPVEAMEELKEMFNRKTAAAVELFGEQARLDLLHSCFEKPTLNENENKCGYVSRRQYERLRNQF